MSVWSLLGFAAGRQGVEPECRTQQTDIKLNITALLLVKRQEKQKPYTKTKLTGNTQTEAVNITREDTMKNRGRG